MTEESTSTKVDETPVVTASDTKTETTTKTDTTTVDESTSSSSSSTKYNYVLIGSYIGIVLLWGISQIILIPYAVHLLSLVTCILYAACHGSIILLHEQHITDPKTGEKEKLERETLKQQDAYQFPLFGSLSLFSLYLAFKFLDKDLVNMLIGAYFAIVGCVAVAMTIAPIIEVIIGNVVPKFKQDIRWEQQIYHPYSKEPIEWNIIFTLIEIIALVLSIIICFIYFYSDKAWYLNNILGISFCIQGIERFSLGTYKIGAILLIGLFFYDIFWVFGTEVMVTVAKNLDGPIKLLLPRTFEINEETGKLKDLSLLGLGDIVIPGFFLALLLRFDAHKYSTNNNDNKAMNIHDEFPKPYFHSALLAYILGLGTTLLIMIKFNAAQPALLYLVPACLGSSLLCATIRGEITELFAYSEEEEEEEGETKDDEKKDAKNKETKDEDAKKSD